MADSKTFQYDSSERLISPVLPAIWPHLGTPKTGDIKFHGEFGSFDIGLRLDPNNTVHAQFIDRIRSFEQASVLAVAAHEGEDVSDLNVTSIIREEKVKDDKGNKTKTGYLLLNFKQLVKRSKDGRFYNTAVNVVDCSQPPKLLTTEQKNKVYGGSLVRVSFTLTPYFIKEVVFGKDIIAVQIVKPAADWKEEAAIDSFNDGVEGWVADDSADDSYTPASEETVNPTTTDDSHDDF